MTNRVNPALGFVGAVVLLGTILSCQSPGGLYDLERVGPNISGISSDWYWNAKLK